jgi:hypothetical protein
MILSFGSPRGTDRSQTSDEIRRDGGYAAAVST